MKLTRREFHQALVTSALTAALPGRLTASTGAGDDATALVLNRLTFGATQQSRAAFAQHGLNEWLEIELARPATIRRLTPPGLRRRCGSPVRRVMIERGTVGPQPISAPPFRPDADPADHVHLLYFAEGMDFGERTRPAQETAQDL